jgi:hypothetical protein
MISFSDVLYGAGIAAVTMGTVLLTLAPLYWLVWVPVMLMGIVFVLLDPLKEKQ